MTLIKHTAPQILAAAIGRENVLVAFRTVTLYCVWIFVSFCSIVWQSVTTEDDMNMFTPPQLAVPIHSFCLLI